MLELPAAERTLPRLLQALAADDGTRTLLSLGGQTWTRADAAQHAATRAGALQTAGVQRGDRVALMCSNRVELLEAFLGCGWMGAAAVPVNTASMGPQIEYLLANSGARLLVIDEAFVPRLDTADLSRTALQAIWVLGQAGDVQGVACTPWPAPGAAVPPADVRPGDALAVMYTSGTTGPSKGVLCPHAQYHWWGVMSARILGLRADDVLCTTLPLFHINALNTFAQAMVSGARVVYETRFSASGFWPAMQQHGATVIYLLGAMVPILLAQPVADVECQHRVRLGLGPGVPAAAGQAFLARTGVPLLEGYGSTETNFVIATRPGEASRGVMGWVQGGFHARVVDDEEHRGGGREHRRRCEADAEIGGGLLHGSAADDEDAVGGSLPGDEHDEGGDAGGEDELGDGAGAEEGREEGVEEEGAAGDDDGAEHGGQGCEGRSGGEAGATVGPGRGLLWEAMRKAAMSWTPVARRQAQVAASALPVKAGTKRRANQVSP